MDLGRDLRSAKLLLMLIFTRVVAKHKLSGTNSSSLKPKSSSFKFFSEPIDSGRTERLFELKSSS
ncbi:hypothetical protein Hanom_Chr10g00926751 [Helianthus anomalus]